MRPFLFCSQAGKNAKKRRFLAKTTLCVSLIIKNELLTLRKGWPLVCFCN